MLQVMSVHTPEVDVKELALVTPYMELLCLWSKEATVVCHVGHTKYLDGNSCACSAFHVKRHLLTLFLWLQIEKLVQDVDAAVYVLDYTKLKTSAEAEMLQAVRKINPALMHRIWHRMFFVVNKFDVASTGHGLDEAETKHYVKTLLRDAGFNVKLEQVLGRFAAYSEGKSGFNPQCSVNL